jgi:hypothetical protein
VGLVLAEPLLLTQAPKPLQGKLWMLAELLKVPLEEAMQVSLLLLCVNSGCRLVRIQVLKLT